MAPRAPDIRPGAGHFERNTRPHGTAEDNTGSVSRRRLETWRSSNTEGHIAQKGLPSKTQAASATKFHKRKKKKKSGQKEATEGGDCFFATVTTLKRHQRENTAHPTCPLQSLGNRLSHASSSVTPICGTPDTSIYNSAITHDGNSANASSISL